MTPTVGDAVSAAARCLAEAGAPEPRLDARLLVEHALGDGLVPSERLLGAGERERFGGLVARRAQREPLAHITGLREFWSLPIHVTRDTLIPRPDSETLVEAALDRVADRRAPLSVLDLGTGSGCLLLALLHELPTACGIGLDIDARALAVARENAATLGLAARARFVGDDWARGLKGRFDLIVCNPPYVAEGDLARLDPEVAAFEPHRALAGGPDGLDCYRRIAPRLRSLLAKRGAAFLEVGAGQAAAVTGMLGGHGLDVIGTRNDLAGIPRCVVALRQ